MSSLQLLTEEISALHKDLLAFRARTEQWFDKIDSRFDKIDGRLGSRIDRIDSDLRRLREDMPGIVRSAMHAVERTSRRNSRNQASSK